MAGITINPALTTNALGGFSTTTEGYVQGVMLDDPAVRYALASGIVLPTATVPMWGGEAITDSLYTAGVESDSIGSVLTLATSLATITGWTVFNQASAMIQTPQSPVPLSAPGAGVNFFRLGSGARIAVGCTATNAATFLGGASNQQCSWDYTNQVLIPYTGTGGNAGAIPVKILDVNIGDSMTVVYSSGTGFATWNRAGSTVLIQI